MIIRDAMFRPFLHSLLPRILPPDRKRIRSKEGTTVTMQRRTRKWMPSPLVTRPKHAHRSACTPIDNRIISREPARRLMSALMNNRLRMALCRRSINRSTNGYREFTPRNPDIRLCAIVIPSIHPRILDSFRGYLCENVRGQCKSIRIPFDSYFHLIWILFFSLLLEFCWTCGHSRWKLKLSVFSDF